MTRITNADLTYQLGNLSAEFAALGLRTEGLTLAEGSKTYGRAYRLHYRDSQTGGLSSVPGTRSDFLGMTKAEAYQALKHMIDGIRLTRDALDHTSRV